MNVNEYSLIRNLSFCFQNTLDCYPPLLMWCGLAILVNTALPVLTTFLPKVVIQRITSDDGVKSLAVVTLAFTLGIAILSGLKIFIQKIVYFQKYRMNTYYTGKIAYKGMTTDYENQEREHFRKLQSEVFTVCNGHDSPMAVIYENSITLLSNALGFLLYFGILAKLSPSIVLFLISTTLASYFLNKQIVRWTSDNNKEKIGYQQRTDYINNSSGDLRSAKDIRLYRIAAWFDKLYNINLAGLAGWYRRYAAKVFGVSVLDSGLSMLREGAAYAYLLYLVLTSHIGVADFVLYFGVITGFSVWLSGILGQINTLNRTSLSFNYLRAYLDYPENYRREGGIETDGLMAAPKTIELCHVRYRYEGADADTLQDVSLTLKAGEHLAVVGLNGAGKTTLVKLICGLTDPTGGMVCYNGDDVKAYNRIAYYRLFSAVFQHHSILPVTIEEIVAESVTAQIDLDRVRRCLKTAGLWEKIESLPKGLKSEFGRTIYDDGVEFSGGEIQKLLLARALYKDAPVMILDEPTAALDPIAESRLYESYDEILRGHSAVFISHRLASTRFCDRILLIENGRIIEEGTHEMLLMKKGRYFELFETQAKYYREHPDGEKVNA